MRSCLNRLDVKNFFINFIEFFIKHDGRYLRLDKCIGNGENTSVKNFEERRE